MTLVGLPPNLQVLAEGPRLEGNPTTLAPDSQNGSVPQSQYRNKLIYVIDDQGQQGLAGAIMIDNDIPILRPERHRALSRCDGKRRRLRDGPTSSMLSGEPITSRVNPSLLDLE